MSFIFTIKGEEVPPPKNWEGIEIKADWSDSKDELEISLSTFQFLLRSAEVIKEQIDSGLSGGGGVFEKLPFDIQVEDRGDSLQVFNGYIDLTQNLKITDDCEYEVTVKKDKGADWLADVAGGITWGFLADKGFITPSDYVPIPYVKNYKPDALQLITLGIATYMMVKELIEAIRSIADGINAITEGSIPSPVISVFPGVAINVPGIVGAILKLIINIAYAIAIVFAIIKLVIAIIEELIPFKRHHLGIKTRTLYIAACNYLGLSFKSSIFDNDPYFDEVLMPPKDKPGSLRRIQNTDQVGFPESDSPIYTFADLIVVDKTRFNADFKIINNQFQFERRDFWLTGATFTLPDVFSNQDLKKNENGFNTDEFVKTYNINYRFDNADQNTLDDQTGRIYQTDYDIQGVAEGDLLMKGLAEIVIPYALPKRKDSLTVVEIAIKAFAFIVDGLTGFFGRGTAFAQRIESRKDALLLSDDFTGVTKVMIMQGQGLRRGQRDLLSTKNLWDDFHIINSFDPNDGTHNQYLLFRDVTIPFCFRDFLTLVNNNGITTVDGNKGEVEQLSWSKEANTAIISYRVNEVYNNSITRKEIT